MESYCGIEEQNTLNAGSFDSKTIDDISNFNIEETNDLKNEIETSLTKGEHIEIFKLIRRDGIIYTENKNGIFINMNKLKPDTLDDMKKFVEFTKKNRTNFENDNMVRENIKNMINNEMNKTLSYNSPPLNNNEDADNDVCSKSHDTNTGKTYSEQLNDDNQYDEITSNNTQDIDTISFNNQEVHTLSQLENELSGSNNLKLDRSKFHEKKKKKNT
jgi:hypothetical protein